MTQHLRNFIQECITVTADGSLAATDEVEGLYQHWSSLRAADTSDTSDTSDDAAEYEAEGSAGSPVLAALRGYGVETVRRDGVEYLEGLVLTGPVVADFILSCDFAGAWGRPDPLEPDLLEDVASAEGPGFPRQRLVVAAYSS
ncbi:hypothetical protein [Arthrobacter sp. B0490]|uniref:hypothetical protein n=1 Tax=Arthrobacter sp. B0490 TaxID=2058891 RepID=UPI000CE42E98|nr:hypothetical protein [Arthrobacter sp. B0490]